MNCSESSETYDEWSDALSDIYDFWSDVCGTSMMEAQKLLMKKLQNSRETCVKRARFRKGQRYRCQRTREGKRT